MRAQSDATKTDQENEESRSKDDPGSPPPALDCRNHKKDMLTVKQSSTDGVAAGKTVARPIYKWPFGKRPMPMHQNLDPFVEKHPARNGQNQSQQRWPPA